MNKSTAYHLARKLEAYWRKFGFDVKATVIREADATPGRDGSEDAWTIRTDPPLRGGLPQGARQTIAGPILRSFDKQHNDWRKFDDERPEND